MDRAEILLGGLDKSSSVIEIGPSYGGLTPKRDGWDCTIIDHDTQDGLVAKYTQYPGVDISKIERVDFVWRGGSLLETVPTELHGTFDAFIASHVIEHTTDVIAFLQAASGLIKPDGRIILALPDKRKCFDLFRPLSTTGEAIAAYHEKRSRHTLRTHLDHGLLMATRNGGPGWFINEQGKAKLYSGLSKADAFAARAASPDYVDAHQWVFVPASFELMILELNEIGLLDLHIDRVSEAGAIEFYAWLKRREPDTRAEEIQERRVSLMDRQIVELAEQSRQIPDSPLNQAERELAELKALFAEHVIPMETGETMAAAMGRYLSQRLEMLEAKPAKGMLDKLVQLASGRRNA